LQPIKLHNIAALAAALLYREAPAEIFYYINKAHEDLDLLFTLTIYINRLKVKLSYIFSLFINILRYFTSINIEYLR
jgi:hypothetical protein